MRMPARLDDWSGIPPKSTSPLSRRSLLAGAAAMAKAVLPQTASASKFDAGDIVESLLDEMSLRERIAQLFMFQAHGVRMSPAFEGLLTSVRPGGVIFVQPNIGTSEDVRRFVRDIHRSNRAAPPVIAIDQEGGDVIRLPGDPVPGAIVLGGMPDDEVRSLARARARFLASYGFDVNFAPVADVAYARSSMMYLRSFGSDPRAVAAKVQQMVRGSRQINVMGAAKHFPGHGRTSVDSHVAMPTVDLDWDEWRKTDALPFEAAIKASVEMVMLGHLKFPKWDDAPTSLSRVAVDALRDELNFEGVIVTDDLGMGALAGINPLDVIDRALAAGVDLLLYTMPPLPWPQMIDHVEKRVREKRVSRRRVDASVRRLLRMKVEHFGLEGS